MMGTLAVNENSRLMRLAAFAAAIASESSEKGATCFVEFGSVAAEKTDGKSRAVRLRVLVATTRLQFSYRFICHGIRA